MTRTTSGGVNLIGYASAQIGLGTVVREFAKAMEQRGVPVAIHDLQAGGGRSGADMSLSRLFVADLDELPHDLNVWIVGSDMVPAMARRLLDAPRQRARANAVFLWWELPDVPRAQALAATAFDAVITGSEFVRESWAMAVPGMPVLLAPHPLDMPTSMPRMRHRYGLKDEQTVFFTGFEPTSDPARKNPFGAVHAFRMAFSKDDDARLVLKVNNPGAAPHAQGMVAELLRLIEGDDRVVLVRDRLSRDELLSLYASSDVTVSLHRAEGLGLVPLEAMRLGVPAIATGWSGNMTYMTHAGAALVRYLMTPTDASSGRYSPTKAGVFSRWAEPDTAHAAQWMRRLRDDEGLRQGLATAALRDATDYDARARRLGFLDELQAISAARQQISAGDAERLVLSIRNAQTEQRYFGQSPLRAGAARLRDGLQWRVNLALNSKV